MRRNYHPTQMFRCFHCSCDGSWVTVPSRLATESNVIFRASDCKKPECGCHSTKPARSVTLLVNPKPKS